MTSAGKPTDDGLGAVLAACFAVMVGVALAVLVIGVALTLHWWLT